jgi:hypothetical protein
MKKHPELKEVSIEEQYKLVHEAGGMVIHAHPYREAWYIPEIRLYPEYVDGVEICNASHYGKKICEDGRTMYDVQAAEYAAKYNLPCTGGSDIHHATQKALAALETETPCETVADLCAAIRERKTKILRLNADELLANPLNAR